MKKLGFFQSHYDHTLYLNYNGTYVAVYVNNLQIVGTNLNRINRLKIDLVSRFKITDLGSTIHYLEMEVMRENNTIIVTQTVYIDQLLTAHQIFNYNIASMLIIERLCLVPTSDYFKPLPADVTAYKRFIQSI